MMALLRLDEIPTGLLIIVAVMVATLELLRLAEYLERKIRERSNKRG